MAPNMRRKLPGTFLPHYLGEDAWRLSCSGSARVEVFVRGAGSQAADMFGAPDVHDIAIEWLAGGVLLTVSSAGRPDPLRAKSAIVHEPLPCLYEGLPLAGVDAKHRRFWRGIFWVMRIPGGRLLLGVLARRHSDSS
jgi:hypothetical protein